MKSAKARMDGKQLEQLVWVFLGLLLYLLFLYWVLQLLEQQEQWVEMRRIQLKRVSNTYPMFLIEIAGLYQGYNHLYHRSDDYYTPIYYWEN